MNAPLKLMRRDAAVQPATAGTSHRIEILASTGADVVRSDGWGGKYIERLDTSAAAINMEFINSGRMPLLDSHNFFNTSGVIGTVVSGRVTPAGLMISADLPPDGTSDATDESTGKIKAGVLNNVSVGYRIDEMTITEENNIEVRTATRWTPMEISVVALGADPNAQIVSRSAPATRKEPPMDILQTQPAPGSGGKPSFMRQANEILRRHKIEGNDALDLLEAHENNLESFRTAVLDHLAVKEEKIPTRNFNTSIAPMGAGPMATAEYVGEALFARTNPGHVLSDGAKPYKGLSLRAAAELALENAGERVSRFASTQSIITRAASLSTSDLPNMLTSAANRYLAQSYNLALSPLKTVSVEKNLPDFRPRSRLVLLDDSFKLEEKVEGGNFNYGHLSESKTQMKLKTAGKILKVTREVMVNDDLGALSNFFVIAGRAAAIYEAENFVGLLNANSGHGATFEDGNPTFHTSHNNIASSGSAPTVDSLSAARLAMREQKTPEGGLVGYNPAFLVVGPALETQAEKLVTSIQPVVVDQVNPFTRLKVLVEPRITDNRWYLVADPASGEGVAHAYLDGNAGPLVDGQIEFESAGIGFRVMHDFTAGFVEYRSWYLNPGV